MKVFVVVLIPWWAAVMGEPSMNKIYTFFSDKEVSWNMASEICSQAGMSIASPFIQEDYQELFQLRMSAEWNNNKEWDGRGSQKMWTGVHSSPSGTLFWANCNIFEPPANSWLDIGPDDNTECLLLEIKDTPKWLFKNCDDSAKVVCETISGPCNFVPQVDTVIDSFVQQHFVSATSEKCQESCLLAEFEGKKCWAYIYHSVNTTCSLYHTETRQDIVAAQMPGADVEVQLKNCTYYGVKNTTALGNDPHKRDKYPLSNCTSSTKVTSPVPLNLETIPSTTEAGTSTAALSDPQTAEYGTTRREPSTTQSTRTLTSSTTMTTTAITLLTPPVTKAMRSTFGTGTPTNTVSLTEATSDPEWVTHPNAQLTDTLPSTTGTQGQGEQTYSFSTPRSTDVTKGLGQDMLSKTDTISDPPFHLCSPCRCSEDNQTEEQKVTFIKALLQELTINTSQTSSSRRRKVSVPDDRRSAVSIGVLGGVFLSLPFVLIVSTDILTVIAHLQSLWDK